MLGTSFINKFVTPELQIFAEVEVPNNQIGFGQGRS
jgi:hypothetical protein